MKVIVEQHTERHDLVCRTENGRVITVDPFVGCSVRTTDNNYMEEGDKLVGKTFDMQDFWIHKDGCYLCHEFVEVAYKEISG